MGRTGRYEPCKLLKIRRFLLDSPSRTVLDVQELYQLRKPLVRKGALGPARRPDPERRRPGWQRCWLGDPMLRPNKAWVDELLPGTPPNSALGKALGYAHRQWKKLVLCYDKVGAQASANLLSLVLTCRANDVDRFEYFSYIFEHFPMATTIEALEALLPWNLKPVLEAQRKRRG